MAASILTTSHVSALKTFNYILLILKHKNHSKIRNKVKIFVILTSFQHYKGESSSVREEIKGM